MYRRKKGGFVVLVVLLLFVILGFTLLFSKDRNITGAAISVGLPETGEMEILRVPAEETVEIPSVVESIADTVAVPDTAPTPVPEQETQRSVTAEIETLRPTIDVATCGTLSTASGNYDLTGNVSSAGTCFNISANNIVLNCQGFNITYGAGGLVGHAINNSNGYDNITVQGCRIFEGSTVTSDKYAIYFANGAENATITNNTIVTTGISNSFGIYILNSNRSTIKDNTITTYGTNGEGISLGSDNSTVDNNTISTNGSNSYGIQLRVGADYNVLRRNRIRTINTSAAYGIYCSSDCNDNWIENNNISTADRSVFIQTSVNRTTFLNNNLTSSGAEEILDNTGDAYINYLIYNNSFGEIRWTHDNESGSFLRDVDIADDGRIGIGIGKSIFINNNSIAFNVSAYTTLKINSSANITFFGLDANLSMSSRVIRVDNVTITAVDIISAGTNCTIGSCMVLSFNFTTGVLVFNTSFFSSFAAHPTVPLFTSAANSSPNFRRYQNFTANITLNSVVLDNYIFSTNASGVIINRTKNVKSVRVVVANESANITAAKNTGVCWSYWANDTFGRSNTSGDFCLTVRNTPPIFNETIGTRTTLRDVEFSIGINCSDAADNDTITYYDNTTTVQLNETTGRINDTPIQADVGNYHINITCGDGEVNISQLMIYSITEPVPVGGGEAGPAPVLAGPAAPAAPAALAEAPPAEAPAEEEFLTPEETQEFGEVSVSGPVTGRDIADEPIILIGETLDLKKKREVKEITFILENNGPKKMRLFPRIFQTIDDPYFIITRKSLGYSDSLFSKIAGLTYSSKPVAGRLLEAEIINPEQIILEPGQRIEKKIEVQEGLAPTEELKIQFVTGETVIFEQELEITKKIFSGSAIDPRLEENMLDVYVFIAPSIPVEELEKYYEQQSLGSITGAAVLNSLFNGTMPDDEYFLEINIIKKEEGKENSVISRVIKPLINSLFRTKTKFADLYGPYKLKEEQILIFAQQFAYNPLVYNGDYIIKTTIFKGSKVIIKNEFEITLG